MSTKASDGIVAPLFLEDILGSEDGTPLQICQDEETARFVVRALNEGGFRCVDFDLMDVLEWVAQIAPGSIDISAIDVALKHAAHLV